MKVAWTREQQKVIDLRKRNILVSAAAGSGKTAVLVERILKMITDDQHPVDIDRLLIVTFTRAAAGEMRERLGNAIEQALMEQPENEHLQKQTTLIHNAQINTIDGFCSYIVRNYFHMTDLDPGFRVADEGELKLLETDVIRKLLEDEYARKDPDYTEFVECYATGKTDEGIEEMVRSLYHYSMSYPWPEEWLENCRDAYLVSSMEEMEASQWMVRLQKNCNQKLEDLLELCQQNLRLALEPEGPYMYEAALLGDQEFLELLAATESFNERVKLLGGWKHKALSSKKDSSVSDALRARVQNGRNQLKAQLKELKENYYSMRLEEVYEDLIHCRTPILRFIDLTMEYSRRLLEEKREKNLLDFADIEHYALKILLEKQEEGSYVPSGAARDFQERFEEILIDEYQDSNYVQELLLTSVSRIHRGENNLFMVGDVKQSIYRFRMARPELFMEKFGSYSLTDGSKQRIDLHKNFRSRDQVLAGVNYLFRQIMGTELGGVEYDDDAALYPGASYPEGEEAFLKTEVMLLTEEETEHGEAPLGKAISPREKEALAVAMKIRELIAEGQVVDKKSGEYRPIVYGDIVILLRSVAGWADVFGRVLNGQGIPAYSVSRTGYFDALEVVTILNYLHICDNPCQEIPYTAVLRSPIVGCNAEELAEIKNISPEAPIYACTEKYRAEGSQPALVEKLEKFLNQLHIFRRKVPYTPIHQLLVEILQETGYAYYAEAMPLGEQRSANLHMLVERAIDYEKTSYKGLFNFIRYIENLKKYDVDFGEVNILGENANTVRIMSIHKSKGLEFPVVFACGMGKKANHREASGGIMIHQELGIGADAIYPEERLKAPTLMKEVLRHENRMEEYGEELRILYVAFTRAKEKLILTGTFDHPEKAIPELESYLYRKDTRLPYGTLEKMQTYWSWILPALARHRDFAPVFQKYGITTNPSNPLYEDAAQFQVYFVTTEDLVVNQAEQTLSQTLTKEELLHWNGNRRYDEEMYERICQYEEYVYPYERMQNIPVKVTVSELKKKGQDSQESEELFYEPDIIPLIPGFMSQEEGKYEGAAKGTAYHKVMECLNFEKTEDLKEILEQMNNMMDQNKLDLQMYDSVNPEDILRFAKAPCGKRMQAAQMQGALYREQPFVIAQDAHEMNPDWEGQQILVQGIMDVFFYEEDEIVLLDYKTDKVASVQQLRERYQVQLDYYGEALTRMTGKKVKEKIIYSFFLHDSILC